MKKLIVVPVVAVVAAVGAASAAGFAGGVSAGTLQVGQDNDLECAQSAEVVEWGYDDGQIIADTPAVDNVRVKLNDADCAGQSLTVLPITPAGKQLSNSRASGRIPAQAAGTQYVRLSFNTPQDAEQMKAVRISIDPGFGGQPTGSVN